MSVMGQVRLLPVLTPRLDVAGPVGREFVVVALKVKQGVYQIQANPAEGHARVVSNQYNLWGVIHVLHTFTGVSVTNPKQTRG